MQIRRRTGMTYPVGYRPSLEWIRRNPEEVSSIQCMSPQESPWIKNQVMACWILWTARAPADLSIHAYPRTSWCLTAGSNSNNWRSSRNRIAHPRSRYVILMTTTENGWTIWGRRAGDRCWLAAKTWRRSVENDIMFWNKNKLEKIY